MKRATITDVARLAGVSPTSVSFAYNKPDQLHADTCAKIFAAADQLQFVPNAIARALANRRTNVIGLLLPQAIGAVFGNPYFQAFVRGAGAVCDENRLVLMLLSPDGNSVNSALQNALADGFIVVGFNESHEEIRLLIKRNVPLVIVDGFASHVPSVNVDNEAGAYSAAHYLLDNSHRDIAVLSFMHGHEDTADVMYGVGGKREQGYLRAFERHKLPITKNDFVQTVASIEGGADAFDTLWDMGRRPTALLAMSDAMAIGAVKAALARGIRVPDQLEVIGFDDIELASLVEPKLSTIHQPIEQKGRAAVNLLMNEIAAVPNSTQERSKPEAITLSTQLILRHTTR